MMASVEGRRGGGGGGDKVEKLNLKDFKIYA